MKAALCLWAIVLLVAVTSCTSGTIHPDPAAGGNGADALAGDGEHGDAAVGDGRGADLNAGTDPEHGDLGPNTWVPARDADDNVLPSAFQGLPLGRWLAVQGEQNDLADVREPELYPSSYGIDGFHNITNAWGGAAWNADLYEMYISGGGHGDASMTETGVYMVSGRTLRATRVIDRQPLSSALKWDGTALVPGEGYPGGTNTPTSTGVPGSMHTYEGLVWIPPSVMSEVGSPAPVHGGLFYPGNAKSLINLDTKSYSKVHWSTSYWDISYITAVRWNTRILFPLASWYVNRWDMQLTEMTDWQTSGWDPTPTVPSFGAMLPSRSSSIQFVSGSRLFCDLPERGQMVSFHGDQMATRVRYGDAETADASDWTSYHEIITLTGPGAVDFTVEALNDAGTAANLLSQGGAHYLHSAGEIWVCPVPVGKPLYRVTGLSSATWNVEKLAGSETLTPSGTSTYGRFVVYDMAGVKIGLRVSSTSNPIEVIRLP